MDVAARRASHHWVFDLDKAEMFFLWRSYMEPGTNVGPDDNELLYDRAIYFGDYDFPEP